MARFTMVMTFLLILLSLQGCYRNSSQKQPNSGIEGQVRLGPLSAMVSNKKKANDKPYQATLNILDQNREKVTQIETDEQGRFRIALKPGRYIISPIAPNPAEPADSPGAPSLPKPPYPEERKVTVKPDEYTQIIVRYDTGIR